MNSIADFSYKVENWEAYRTAHPALKVLSHRGYSHIVLEWKRFYNWGSPVYRLYFKAIRKTKVLTRECRLTVKIPSSGVIPQNIGSNCVDWDQWPDDDCSPIFEYLSSLAGMHVSEVAMSYTR